MVLEEGADLAEQVADLRPDDGSELRETAAVKRELARRVRQTVEQISRHPLA